MDAEKRTEIIVGVVVVCGIFALSLGLIWGKGFERLEPRHDLVAWFADVRGLEPGDPVMVRGMKKGDVEEIVLRSDHVEVRYSVKKSVTLFSNMAVCVEDRELMGGKKLTLNPGNGSTPADLSRPVWGAARSDMMLLMLKVERVLSRADSAFLRMHRLVDQLPVEELVGRLNTALETATATVQENRASLRQGLSRMDRLTAELERDSTAQHLSQVLRNLEVLSLRLDSTAVELGRLAAQARDPQGTAGRLMGDDQLYDRAVETISRLDSLLADIKRDPKRYFKVSVF